MRIRIWLNSVVVGAAILAGSAATTAQAAPASAETATASCSPVLSQPGGPVYLCRTMRDCQETGENLGYEVWYCRSLPSGWWELFVWA